MTDSSTARPVAAGAPALVESASGPRASLQRYWLVSHLFATAGALLVALAAWMAWVSVRIFGIDNSIGAPLFVRFQLDPGDLSTAHFGGVIWGIVTVFGLLLVPFLWQHPRSGWLAALAPVVYVGWVVVLLFLGGLAASSILQPGAVNLVPELRSSLITIGDQQLLPGAWLGGAGALIALAGAGALVGSLARHPAAARSTAAPARAWGGRRPAIGALVFGVLLFWLGTLILPWTTVNCTATPLFFGQCTGLPFDGVLADAIRADVSGLDPLAAIYGVNVLLSGGALLVLLAVFAGARSRYFAFWTTAWLLVATGFFILASVGVRLVARAPAQFGLRGVWTGDIGILVTLLALAIGWLGVGALWLDRQRSTSA